MNETFAFLERFPHYRFCSDGRIERWRVKKKFWRPLRPNPGINGYPYVSLRDSAGRKATRRVHALILEAFIGPMPDGLVRRHLDGNPLNCAIANLRYGTYLENELDKRVHGTSMAGVRHHQAKLSEADITRIRSELANVSLPTIARMFNVTPQAIWRIRHRITWRHV